MGEAQYAGRIIGPDCQEEEAEDDAPVLPGGKLGGDPAQILNSKPKPKHKPRPQWPYEVDRGLQVEYWPVKWISVPPSLGRHQREAHIKNICFVTGQKD